MSVVFAAALMMVVVPAAQAAWPTGASLVSGSLSAGSPYQSAVSVTGQTVSDDGRYAFFFSSASGLSASAPNGGLFRKNLQNDAAALDVVVPLPAPVAGVQCGVSGNVSASSNGRYVAFASGENGLVAADTNSRRDVFVRDMNVAAGPAAYELASAPDGATAGATYTLVDGGGTGLPIPVAQNCLYGADVPGPNSITNDGKKVLFSNSAFTSIAHVGAGDTTAPGQLFVRSLAPAAPATELVTKVAYNIAYNIPGVTDPVQNVGDPLPDQEFFDSDPNSSARTAPLGSISGDGSAVTWAGPYARNQAAYHRGENVVNSELGSYNKVNYLYRRIADGAAATTRRVISWSDVDDFTCDPNFASYDFVQDPATAGETACAGPVSDEGIALSDARVPQITDNGRRTFFLLDLRGRFLTGPTSGYPNDLVTADMTPGVSRKAGFRYLTQATIDGGGAYPDAIQAFSASGNGKHVAFSTTRRDFSSTGLVPVGPMPPSVSYAAIFEIDGSGAGGFVGAPVEWTARPNGSTDVESDIGASLSLSRTGDTLVFASSDTDFYGIHNGQQQAFCVKLTGTCAATVAVAAPTVEISNPVNGATSSSPVSGTYSTGEATSVTCQWDAEAALAPCPTSPLALKTLSAGSHTFSVTASNGAGSTTVTSSFTVGTLPTVVISAPLTGATNLVSPITPTYTTSGATSVICWFDNSAWMNPCPPTPPATTLVSGSHTFNVKVTNAAGVSTTSSAFTVLNAPTVKITKPFNNTQWASPLVATFTSTDATTRSCQWDATAAFACTSPLPSRTLTAGVHTLKVTVTNANGTATQTNSVTVGPVILPVVTINTPATGSTVASPVVGLFTLTGGGATTVSCRWDTGNVISNCASPMTSKALAPGAHVLTVTATNTAGSAVGTSNFTIAGGGSAPVVAITAPANNANATSSSINAAYTVDGSTTIPGGTTCTVAGAASTTPTTNSVALAVGANTIAVACTNSTGTDTKTVTVNRGTAPVVTISTPADNSNTTSATASVAWTSTGTAPVACTVNGSAATSPATASLVAGPNTITVVCTNAFGTDTKSVTVNRGIAPVITISAPGNPSTTTTATTSVVWSSTGTAPVTCTVNGGAATSPATVNLVAGSNVITVVCTNAFGADTKTVNVTYNPGVAPVVTISAPVNNSNTTAATASVVWTSTGTAPVSCTVDGLAATSPSTVNLAVGSSTITVVCTNATGSDTKTVTVIRGTAPVVTISAPADNSNTTSATASVAWTSTGTAPVACTVNGSAATSPATANLVAGPNTITVVCTNAFGSDTKFVTVNRGIAPVVTISAPANNSTTTVSTTSVAWSSTGTAPVTCTVNGSSETSPATVNLVSGANVISVACTNAFGADTKTVNVTFNPGNAPVVTISAPSDDSNTTASTASVTWTTAGTAPITCTVNGSTATSPATVNLALGSNTITVVCTNSTGSDTKTVTVVRGIAPVVTISAPANNSTTTVSTTSVAWSSTGTAPVACTVNGSSETSPATVNLVSGENTISVDCTNAFGADAKTVNVTFNPGNAPVVTITAPANGATLSSPVVASYIATGATSKTCQWDSEPLITPCPLSPLAPKGLSDGVHTFTVNGTNASGTTTATRTFTVSTPASVTKGATTIIVNFPRYCQLVSGDTDLAPYARFQVSNVRLEAMFKGDSSNDQWGEFLPGIKAIPGNIANRTTAQCMSQTIKRVVRPDASAQTDSLKSLLNAVAPSTGWTAAFAGTTWPNAANVITAPTGGATSAAELVRNTLGSIGYADLAAARANAFKKLAESEVPPAVGTYKYDLAAAVQGASPTDWIYTFNKRLFWIPLEKTATAGSFAEPTAASNAIRSNKLGSACPGTPTGDWATGSPSLLPVDFPLCTIAE